MNYLSSPVVNIRQNHYTVVVVGSGYGGAIAASRLARAGQQVCLLERGREFLPGEFPDTEKEALVQMQANTPELYIGSHLGLYDFHLNPDINVFVGCGLGGTSLVNANVSLRADPRVFADARWPKALRDDLESGLAEGYKLAEEMLKPVPYPESFPSLRKTEVMQAAAKKLNGNFYRTPINVTFENGVNHVGVEQQACKLCGDCVSGCNHGAKNTTAMNYLPDARNHGAEIYTQASVQRLEPRDDHWVVYYDLVESGRERFDAPALFITADIVVLAAGTLGSTEILLRSKAAGLSLSDHIGKRFTGNGDVLGFGYNNDEVIKGVGYGSRKPEEAIADLGPVGPCITSIIDARNTGELNDGMVIEEGSLPGALDSFYPKAFSATASVLGQDTDEGLQDAIAERLRKIDSWVRGAYHGATRNTQTFLVMSHDGSDGEMRLEDDRLRIDWPGVGDRPEFHAINERLTEVTAVSGGTYVPNPTWIELTKHNLVTVHPLGGCAMGEDGASGVVNHKGQVFSGQQGAEVYAGLYVCDGSIVPRSVGVNPLFTISAIAERNCKLLAHDRGWSISYQLPSAPQASGPEKTVGIRFTETMRGHLSTTVLDDFAKAAARGESDDSHCAFTVTIAAADLERLLKDLDHPARIAGTVIAPALSAEPLTITQGEFSLLSADPQRPETLQMRYRMPLTSVDGESYLFNGFKEIHNDRGLDAWSDTTTLYVTVFKGRDEQAPVFAKGILKIEPGDFARQLTTMQATDAGGTGERLLALARFGQFFVGRLFDTYGGIFARPTVFDPAAPPRKRRDLRVGAPQFHPFKTDDGAELLLMRYRGGKRGPVILSHGLGVSSRIFSTDLIDTNLLEYLYAHEYDVWLLDYRASIALPAAAAPANADVVATQDYPAAVTKVLSITGERSVQMVVHCYGATTFFMAMLAGLQGVRSAVCSQIATHIKAGAPTRIKTGLHLPDFLDALGVDNMTAYVDTETSWWERLYDKALKLYPIEYEERCRSSTCKRISFLYAPLYEHDQLNMATHENLHELFSVANIKAFEHLALLVRTGHLVNAAGEDVYLPHLDRLAIPIRFIHGAENACFLPESTEITHRILSKKNGAQFYDRHVIPDYGHIDCIFGKNAAQDVYPLILEHLEKSAL